MSHHTERMAAWVYLAKLDQEVRHYGLRAAKRCRHGHEHCSLSVGGPCRHEITEAMYCPACKGESDPFDNPCKACGGTRYDRDLADRPVADLLRGAAA